MKQILSIILLTVAMVIGCNSLNESTKLVYQCPMKCEGEKVYQDPGKCKVCGMALEKTEPANSANPDAGKITIVGAMKNVMHLGQLQGTIDLDTIANKKNLFGLGPVEYLSGEIIIVDGKSYRSTVSSDSTMTVEETYSVKAPFFGYANIENWSEKSLPDNIQTIGQLEEYLDKNVGDAHRPFFFRLKGVVEQATIHIVNLPKGSKVSSPEEAHRGQKNYSVTNEQVEILGFFSTEHKAIFTHHDTFLHMHLINDSRTKMGHLDDLKLKSGAVQLYLPAN